MIEHKKIIKYTEIFLILFVWIVLLVTPILFKEENNKPILDSVTKQLEILIPISLLFVVNRFFLAPKLLFKGKRIVYVISVLAIITSLVIGLYFYHNYPKGPTPQDNRPPKEFSDRVDPDRRPGPPDSNQPKPAPPYANFLILSILVIGFDTGLRATLRWTEVEQEKMRLEKENVATQLVLLRNQVSPHFFMNTLNNIHALVDINTDEAKESIIKLSKMMRYLLYETETEKTTLKREIEFLEIYIDLMKLRFNEKVLIVFNIPTVIPDKTIPPFLFTSIIENAFKHGISYKDESFINIDMSIGNEKLLLIVKNSKQNKEQSDDFSGIGIENTRKRLDLLYGKDYHLDIIDGDNMFIVNLSVPL